MAALKIIVCRPSQLVNINALGCIIASNRASKIAYGYNGTHRISCSLTLYVGADIMDTTFAM